MEESYYCYDYIDCDWDYPLAFLIKNNGNLALRGGDHPFDDINFNFSKKAFEIAETENFNNNFPYIVYK